MSCLTFNQPHCSKRTEVGVNLFNLVTVLAALFWQTCRASAKYSSQPIHTGIRYINFDINIPFAIIFLVLKPAVIQIFLRAPTLLFTESQKHYIFPSNLSFWFHKFPTCSGRCGYKNHTFKTCNIISLQITNDLKSRKHPGYTISYSHRSRELIINLLYLGEVRVVIFIQTYY